MIFITSAHLSVTTIKLASHVNDRLLIKKERFIEKLNNFTPEVLTLPRSEENTNCNQISNFITEYIPGKVELIKCLPKISSSSEYLSLEMIFSAAELKESMYPFHYEDILLVLIEDMEHHYYEMSVKRYSHFSFIPNSKMEYLKNPSSLQGIMNSKETDTEGQSVLNATGRFDKFNNMFVIPLYYAGPYLHFSVLSPISHGNPPKIMEIGVIRRYQD